VARSIIHCSLHRALLAHTDLRLAELIGVVVSQESSCRFCYAAQRALLRVQGFPEHRIRQLEGDLVAAELAPGDRAALNFTKRIARASPLPARAEIDSLRAHGFSALAIRELVVAAAIHVYLNRVATLPALPPQPLERLPDRWYVRLLRPLASMVVTRRRRSGRAVALPPAARTGAFAELVVALDGLPAAPTVHRLLSDAFASTVLPAPTKALIFGVVARGLGCPLSEEEARRIAREHQVPASVFDAVLAHLDAPALDPAERAMMRLARDSIRPRPAEVQRRGRALLEQVDPTRFVEFVGTTALANAVCRLGVALEIEP
jgi:alkylhydroperoxidase family enzyme